MSAMMGTRACCDRLRREHALIEEVLRGLDVLTQRWRDGSPVPPPPISGAVAFFSAFVDRCHERKEEEVLFPILDAHSADAPRTSRAEHREGRRLLGKLRPLSGERPLAGEAFALLDTYVELLRRHLASEDAELLPFAERVMSAEDDARAERTFDRIEKRAVGDGGLALLVALGGAVAQACRTMADAPTGPPPEMMAREIMRPGPRTVAPDESLARAAELMETLGTRELPVVKGCGLVGVLTRTDMEPHRGHWEWTAVRTAMTSNPVTVPPEAPIRTVARLLLDRKFNSVPVVAGGELLGMIARSDVLAALADGG